MKESQAKDADDNSTGHVEEVQKSHDEKAQQDSVQKAINKQHAKYREEERKRLAAESELTKLKNEIAENSKTSEPIVPQMPDQFDDNFDELMAERERRFRERVEYDLRQKLEDEKAQRGKDKLQAKKNDELLSRVSNYSDRALQQGITKEELQSIGSTLQQAGISEDLANFILDDNQGPLLGRYLADNPLELDELRHMPTAQAVIKLHSEVRGNISTSNNNITAAPDPVKGVSGKPATNSHPALRGVIRK